MSSSKRHFTAVIGKKEQGTYVSSSPLSAARKAVSKLCADDKKRKVVFSIRETTQKSNKKVYGPYIGYMQKLEGRVIKYKPVAKLNKKSSKMMGGNLSDRQNVGRLSSLQSPAFTNLAGGGPKIPFVAGIISRIMNAAKENSIPIDYDNVVAFANQYALGMPEKWRNFRQEDLEQALSIYVKDVYVEPQQNQDPQPQSRRNQNNLFSQFMRAVRQEKIASEEDIISFAKWYIDEQRMVRREIAENPRQKDVNEMLIFFKQEIMRIKPKWILYKQLFDSTTESLSLDFVEKYLIRSMKIIMAAFGGNLPRDGDHAIPNAYIFKVSPTFNFDHIWEFLSNTEMKGFPCFLYRSREGLHFDKRGASNSVTDGQVCCMFLDAVGMRNTKFDQSVVKIGTPGIGGIYTRSHELVESGLATSIGDLMDGKVHSERVSKEMVKLNPDLLARPFPGLHDFMLRKGAFPLILSIKKED